MNGTIFDDRNETNIMNKTFVIIALFSFMTSSSQDLNCLNHELYNSDYDVIQVKRVSDSEYETPKGDLKNETLQLTVLTDSYFEFPKWTNQKRNGIDKGFKVILMNNSSDDYSLSNMDGKIIIRRQVYFENQWKNVESFNKTRRMICGNSFFTKRVIESGNHLTFVAPCLEGDIKVKFRFVIYTKPANEHSAVYSNEFDGFINDKLIE
jgi:hypothetical protein